MIFCKRRHSREAHSNDTSAAFFQGKETNWNLYWWYQESRKRILQYNTSQKKTEKWFTTILMGFCFYFSIFFGVTISKFTSHPGYRWHICTGPRTWITFCPRASDALYSKTSNQNIPETAAASPSLSQAGGFNLFQCCKFPWFPAGSWMWFGTFRDSSQISHGFPWYIELYGCGSKWKT